MNDNVLVVAPHPDDETLGCGGTLLKYVAQGKSVHWLIITSMAKSKLSSEDRIRIRDNEIENVTRMVGFSSVHKLNFPTAMLDTIATQDMVERIKTVLENVKPQLVLLPYPGDVHSDHRLVFESVIACTKWFRNKDIKRVMLYETLSETDFSINPDCNGFRPNVFVDITDFLAKKIDIMQVYTSEVGQFPFPRSIEAIKALASVRGASSGYEAAEAFMLIKELC